MLGKGSPYLPAPTHGSQAPKIPLQDPTTHQVSMRLLSKAQSLGHTKGSGKESLDGEADPWAWLPERTTQTPFRPHTARVSYLSPGVHKGVPVQLECPVSVLRHTKGSSVQLGCPVSVLGSIKRSTEGTKGRGKGQGQLWPYPTGWEPGELVSGHLPWRSPGSSEYTLASQDQEGPSLEFCSCASRPESQKPLP